jgi:hypothetical protein
MRELRQSAQATWRQRSGFCCVTRAVRMDASFYSCNDCPLWNLLPPGVMAALQAGRASNGPQQG